MDALEDVWIFLVSFFFNITNILTEKKIEGSTIEMKFDKEFINNKLNNQLFVLMKIAWHVCKHELWSTKNIHKDKRSIWDLFSRRCLCLYLIPPRTLYSSFIPIPNSQHMSTLGKSNGRRDSIRIKNTYHATLTHCRFLRQGHFSSYRKKVKKKKVKLIENFI